MSEKLKLNVLVFFTPIIVLSFTLLYGISQSEEFIEKATTAKNWMLDHFDWLFAWSSFVFLIILGVAYFSSLGRKRIGGSDATPILSKWKWFAITLCTTIATGILFWGMAEPLHHLHGPPSALNLGDKTSAAAIFSMATLYMHWSFTPYGVYTITGLVFALAYYNLKQPFSLSSIAFPLLGNAVHHRMGKIIDVICLYALVLGMSASLGTGMFAIMGGVDLLFGWPKSSFLLGGIGFLIVFSFVVSAISGLHKGIGVLSDLNTKAFFGLAVFVLFFGPTLYIFNIGWEGVKDYLFNFIPRSTNLGSELDTQWQQDWTIFYLANWFAWAPIAALFLGRIAVGYTVRQFIQFNLIFPSLFTVIWMSIFGGASLFLDMNNSDLLYTLMNQKGEEVVMFTVLGKLPFGTMVSFLTLVMVFISYVTAADSNVSAMSAISTNGINPENPEAPLWIKIIWGSIIGLTAWLMISTAGVDGIRILSVLGGFPALFLVILVACGLIKLILTEETS